MKLNPKHTAFVDAYFANGFQVAQAYMKVFDSSYETAIKNGSRLLGKPEIRAIVEEKQAEIRERAKITKEDILTQLMNIAYSEKANNSAKIKAYQEINKMLGFQMPIEQNIKITGEQRLFSDDDLTNE